ncbi:hypothetical protein ACHQM5_023864 [Ranunculus cassubicifolius]
MAEDSIDKPCSSENVEKTIDPELFSCLLQPITPDSDLNYVGIRRLLLHKKAQSGVDRRKDWKSNGRGIGNEVGDVEVVVEANQRRRRVVPCQP